MKLKDKKVLVCVTGGIAAYKTCSLVNSLIGQGATVRVLMTENSKKFICPLTFQTLTNHAVYDDLWQQNDTNVVEHIALSHWPDLIIICPITANSIAKLAVGIADNLLTTVILASLPHIKILIAPAMNTNMWNNILNQENILKLKKINRYILAEPRSGILACRDDGRGKIADNDDILKLVISILK